MQKETERRFKETDKKIKEAFDIFTGSFSSVNRIETALSDYSSSTGLNRICSL